MPNEDRPHILAPHQPPGTFARLRTYPSTRLCPTSLPRKQERRLSPIANATRRRRRRGRTMESSSRREKSRQRRPPLPLHLPPSQSRKSTPRSSSLVPSSREPCKPKKRLSLEADERTDIEWLGTLQFSMMTGLCLFTKSTSRYRAYQFLLMLLVRSKKKRALQVSVDIDS